MKLMTVMIAALFLFSTSWAQGQHTQSGRTESMQTASNFTKVAPALEKYARGPLAELWKRPGLTPRDRSLVTIAALIARNQTVEMPYYFDLALNNGVKASELSEVITHLAFYSGWSNAASAVAIAKDVFERRGIGPDQLPPASPELLPLNEDAEADRGACRAGFWQGGCGRRAVHDRPAFPRPVAASCLDASGQQPCHGKRAHRLRPGRADYVSPQSSNG